MKTILRITAILVLALGLRYGVSCAAEFKDESTLKTGVDAVINSSNQVIKLQEIARAKYDYATEGMRHYNLKGRKGLAALYKQRAHRWAKIGLKARPAGEFLNGLNKARNVLDVGGKIVDGDVTGALKSGKDVILTEHAASLGAWGGAKLGACIAGPEGAIIGGLGGAIASSALYNTKIKPCLDEMIDDSSRHAQMLMAERNKEDALRRQWESIKLQRHIAPHEEAQAYELWKLEKTGRLGNKTALASLTSKYRLPEPPEPSPPRGQPKNPLPKREKSRFGEETNWWPTTGYDNSDFDEIVPPTVSSSAKPKKLLMTASSHVLSTIKPAGKTHYPVDKWTQKTVVRFKVIAVYADGYRKDITKEAWYSSGTGDTFCLAGQPVARYPYMQPVTITAKYQGVQASVVLQQKNYYSKMWGNAFRKARRKANSQ